MQTSFYKNTPTNCAAKDCTRCIKSHGACPDETDNTTVEEGEA